MRFFLTRKSIELSELLREIGLASDDKCHHYCAKRNIVVKRLMTSVGVSEKVARGAIKEAIKLRILKTEKGGRVICII